MKNKTFKTKGYKEEDFNNYKKPSLFISNSICKDFKCDKLNKCKVCQNHALALGKTKTINIDNLVELYLANPLTQAIVIGGLEPMDEFEQLNDFIYTVRNLYNCNDDIIIYTGYYNYEIRNYIQRLKQFSNIIIKFGRFKLNEEPYFNELLGVKLANKEQYAERIS